MFPALPRRPKSLKTLGTRLQVVRNSCNGTFPVSTPMSTHDELGSRLGRTIDLPHDTCHLSKRVRIDGIKAMSSGILGGKQVTLFPRVFSLSNMAAVGEKFAGKMYPFLTPSKTDGRVLSQRGAPITYILTFWEVSQQTYMSKHYSPEWVWTKGKIQTFSGRGWGESSSYITAVLDIKSPQTPSVELIRRSVFVHHQQQGSL